jgi:branched-chain amino acid transport system permease protein
MTQIIIQGMLLSGLYALIAIGFTLIFSVGRVLNLAYGAYLMIGGYTYFYISQQLGLPKGIGLILAASVGCLAGLLKYRFIAKPLKGNHVAIEIATLILAIVIQSGIVLLFGESTKILHSLVPGIVRLEGVTAPWSNILATALSWLLIIAVFLFIRNTHTGRAMVAVSQDPKGAAICGINAEWVNMVTWGISGLLGGVAGVFFASYTQLSPFMWVGPLIVTVAIVIVGGIGSIMGTLVVAHIIGFLEIIVVTFIAPELRGIFTMLLIILFLVFRPRGLFGREEIA